MSQESIHVLMSRVMKDISAIEKSQRNQHFNFNFRGIDDVMNALHGPLTKHGVFYTPEVLDQEIIRGDKQWHATLRVRYTFYGPAGDSVPATVTAEGLDSADKAATKAMSTALKYALLQVFCIPTEEQRDLDPDRSGATWDAPAKGGSGSQEPAMGISAPKVSPEEVKAVEETPSPGTGEVVGGDASDTTGASSGDALKTIVEARAAGRVKQADIIRTATIVAGKMNATPQGGVSTKNLGELPEDVLEAVIQTLGLRQEALA